MRGVFESSIVPHVLLCQWYKHHTSAWMRTTAPKNIAIQTKKLHILSQGSLEPKNSVHKLEDVLLLRTYGK